jgi:hypothetical protein
MSSDQATVCSLEREANATSCPMSPKWRSFGKTLRMVRFSPRFIENFHLISGFIPPLSGEMMMSLFWYYRPEHTEQGRQENDASDEVFASRHKDHNSVACIEDKCFVLTYNEYCRSGQLPRDICVLSLLITLLIHFRYRRNLKSLEENLEEQPTLVPKLNCIERRSVPPSTSPELVMFCRRVYDFRSKRLVEDKKKK